METGFYLVIIAVTWLLSFSLDFAGGNSLFLMGCCLDAIRVILSIQIFDEFKQKGEQLMKRSRKRKDVVSSTGWAMFFLRHRVIICVRGIA